MSVTNFQPFLTETFLSLMLLIAFKYFQHFKKIVRANIHSGLLQNADCKIWFFRLKMSKSSYS